MPLFEFRCKKCDHLEEVLQSARDPAPAKCPECGAKKSMSKEISLTSFQLKGGGWYKDLYSSVPASADKSESTGDRAKKADTKAGDKAKKADTKAGKKKASPKKSKSSGRAA